MSHSALIQCNKNVCFLSDKRHERVNVEISMVFQQCCGSGSGQIRIIFLDLSSDPYPGPADPDLDPTCGMI
jgi:hypothetical protein